MKKFRLAAILLCCVLSAGCANEEPETEVFYDIETEEQEPGFVKERADYVLGMQFWQGEPVMLVAKALNPFSEGEPCGDVYLCRADGSSELLVQGIVGYTDFSKWYIDKDKALYGLDRSLDRNVAGTLVKYDPDGREACRIALEGSPLDICQTADGRIYLLLEKNADSPKWLETPDAASGKTVRAGGDLKLGAYTTCIGTGPEGLAAMRGQTSQPVFTEVDLRERSEEIFLTSAGTSYMPRDMLQNDPMRVWDFRVWEDGSLEILWGNKTNGGAVLERLRETRVEKIPLRVRASSFATYEGVWLKMQAARFNRENGTYHVVLEDCEENFEWDAATRRQKQEDYAEITSVEVAAGKGPDILRARVLQGYTDGMAEKGGFEDLAPYMERSGIREEDYYPLTFGAWRDGEKIYGVRTDAYACEYLMDGAVLGTGREPGSMEELTDALLAWRGDEIFLQWTDQAGLLELFLSGSEDLWGMVDWEQGTCDFGGELFGKLLKAAKRYGDDGSGKRAPLAVANYADWNLLQFVSSAEKEEKGLVRVGVLFGDGCHPVTADNGPMMINANSANKEGAWEFIRFLLDEEAQSVCDTFMGRSPVYKAAFPAYVQWKRARMSGGSPQIRELSDEQMGEYVAMLEEAKERPVRTRTIIGIICEETGAYFAGDKSVEETAAIVQNKVQLYLDEIF